VRKGGGVGEEVAEVEKVSEEVKEVVRALVDAVAFWEEGGWSRECVDGR